MSNVEPSLTDVAPTICALFGIPEPEISTGSPLEAVINQAAVLGTAGSISRMLIYAPDALGRWILRQHPDALAQIGQSAPITVELNSVFPPKTPVCFSTVWTGAPPEVHGIRRYERPVLQCDTVFDALVRAGRKVALAVVRDSTNDVMFQERALDYFAEDYDAEVSARASQLISDNRHDFVLAYHQEYDDQLHRTRPDSEQCIAALHRHVSAFTSLVAAAESAWSGQPRAYAFVPDHGSHFDEVRQCGDHGQDIPEDMELLHFWSIRC